MSDRKHNKVLFAWLGGSDLVAAGLRKPPKDRGDGGGMGPIARAVIDTRHAVLAEGTRYRRLLLLDDWDQGLDYFGWLAAICAARGLEPPELERLPVSRAEGFKPMDYEAVYRLCKDAVDRARSRLPNLDPVYLLSAGTPAMRLCWTLLGQTPTYRRQLIDASTEEDIQKVPHWIDLAHSFLPDLRRRQRRMADSLVTEALDTTTAQGLFGGTVLREQLAQAAAYGRMDSPVLIEGESGTGKELIARLIHEVYAKRDDAGRVDIFVDKNCSAITLELAESELFGHERGAFTGAVKQHRGLFEQAGRGTLFLDEIGDLALPIQAKLLRAIQERKIQRVGGAADINVHCRLVTGTHKDLAAMVETGQFRLDLYHRLNVLALRLPPLRERMEVIEELVQGLCEAIGESKLKPVNFTVPSLDDSAFEFIRNFDWPGNIRQLENTLIRAGIEANLRQSYCIDASLLRELLLERSPAPLGLLDRPLEHLDQPDAMKGIIDAVYYRYYRRLYQANPALRQSDLAQRLNMDAKSLAERERTWQARGWELAPCKSRRRS